MAIFVCFMILPCLVLASCYDSFSSIGNWTESIPQIRTHDMFLAHPHLKDLKAAAKRGKIPVITLVVSAGLVVLVSTAILRGGKAGEEADAQRIIEPARLRSCVIAAAIAGRRGLVKGKEQALNVAFTAYARERDVDWEGQALEYSESVTCDVGNDSVTISIPDDGAVVDIRSICGNIGASAIVNAEDGSLRSSVFTLRAKA
ncbi:hypothetical protein ACFL6S_02245 [Candidatus Poribacteria bacterium]